MTLKMEKKQKIIKVAPKWSIKCEQRKQRASTDNHISGLGPCNIQADLCKNKLFSLGLCWNNIKKYAPLKMKHFSIRCYLLPSVHSTDILFLSLFKYICLTGTWVAQSIKYIRLAIFCQLQFISIWYQWCNNKKMLPPFNYSLLYL